MEMPGELRSVRVRHGEVEYYRLGDGPALLLLHGLGGAAEVWYRVAPALAERFTVLAPRLWSGEPQGERRRVLWLWSGRDAANRSRYGVDHGVAFVTDFLDAVGCSTAHICGSSLGGLLAGFTAVRRPERVCSVVLAAAAGLGREAALFLRAMTLPVVGELLFRPSRRRIRRLVRTLVPDFSTVDEALLERLYHDRLRTGVPTQMLTVLRSGIGIRGTRQEVMLSPYLGQIRAPALVLWGERDPLFPVCHGEEAARMLPNGELHVFPGVGHWPYVERPGEFVEVVSSFFVKSTGAGESGGSIMGQ